MMLIHHRREPSIKQLVAAPDLRTARKKKEIVERDVLSRILKSESEDRS